MSNTEKHPTLCDADSSCLVIVDVQEKLAAAMPAKVVHRMQQNTIMLLTAASELNIPILATMQYPKGLGPMLSAIKHYLPPQTPIVEKTRFSCCGVPEFDEFLQAIKRPQVILAGMEMHVCIMQTALELQDAGYQPWVMVDAASSRQRDSYDYSIMRMRANGVILSETEAVLFEWLRDSAHPRFKAISKLLR